MEILFILSLYVGLCFALASAGSSRKIGFWAVFFISLLLSPLIGLIAVIASSPAQPTQQMSTWRKAYEDGKRHEFKGQYEQALDKYMDALYDYGRMYPIPENNKKRAKLLEEQRAVIQCKIDAVKETMNGSK